MLVDEDTNKVGIADQLKEAETTKNFELAKLDKSHETLET